VREGLEWKPEALAAKQGMWMVPRSEDRTRGQKKCCGPTNLSLQLRLRLDAPIPAPTSQRRAGGDEATDCRAEEKASYIISTAIPKAVHVVAMATLMGCNHRSD